MFSVYWIILGLYTYVFAIVYIHCLHPLIYELQNLIRSCVVCVAATLLSSGFVSISSFWLL